MPSAVTRIVLLAFLQYAGSSCEPAPNTRRPILHRDTGMEVQYPANWNVVLAMPGIRFLVLNTSGSAVVTVQGLSSFPDGLKEYAAHYSTWTNGATGAAPTAPSGFGAVEKDGTDEILTEHFSSTVYGIEVGHTRIYRRKKLGDVDFFIVCQAIDEDLRKVQPGFDLIAKSLTYTKP